MWPTVGAVSNAGYFKISGDFITINESSTGGKKLLNATEMYANGRALGAAIVSGDLDINGTVQAGGNFSASNGSLIYTWNDTWAKTVINTSTYYQHLIEWNNVLNKNITAVDNFYLFLVGSKINFNKSWIYLKQNRDPPCIKY